jgi:hypothetical protein
VSRDPMSLFELRVLDIPEVRKGRSRFGGHPAFWVGSREIAHCHDRQEIDVRLTRALIREDRAVLREDRRISLRKNSSDWITVRVLTTPDVELALALVERAWRAAQ